jgi:hypothetical protein
MKIAILALSACVLTSATSIAAAQSRVDRSFTATGRDCGDVRWSAAAVSKYPRIAAACQAVQQRDGKSYVRFEGVVVDNRGGERLQVEFKDAGEMTLTPPPELGVYIDGRKVPVSELERGDELTFYIAEDRLAAQFYAQDESPATTTQYVFVPIVYTQLAERPAVLPETASALPLIGMTGLLLVTLGTLFSVRRWVRYF